MEEAKELSIAMNQIYQRQNDLYHKYASHYGLSDTAFWILYTLNEADVIYTQNQIADMWHFPRQSINSAVSSLVKTGYLYLEKVAIARNNKALRLTEQGMEFCRRVIFPFYELENRVYLKMSKEEREQFLALSSKQCELLESEIKEALTKQL